LVTILILGFFGVGCLPSLGLYRSLGHEAN
jgi:hypothetical protein